MRPRDIPFDEEVAERPASFREACGPGLTAAERAQVKAKVRAMFDEADRMAAREQVIRKAANT